MRRAAAIIGCAGVGAVAGFMAGVWVACETDGQEAGRCFGVVGGAVGGVLGVVVAVRPPWVRWRLAPPWAGSGAIGRAWQLYTSRVDAGAAVVQFRADGHCGVRG